MFVLRIYPQDILDIVLMVNWHPHPIRADLGIAIRKFDENMIPADFADTATAYTRHLNDPTFASLYGRSLTIRHKWSGWSPIYCSHKTSRYPISPSLASHPLSFLPVVVQRKVGTVVLIISEGIQEAIYIQCEVQVDFQSTWFFI
jgi:hypothetical protein